MASQVVFTLYAPYGAWGSPSLSAANAAFKATDLEPSKSALVGLIGAALGEPRGRLGALARALGLAVRVDLPPVREPKPDYHTISKAFVAAEPPPDRRWTRFEELRTLLAGHPKAMKEGSILSWREYWTNGLWTVAVAPEADSPWSPEHIAAGLRAPTWELYAGRKACTLGLPPDPEVVESDTLLEAFRAYGWPWTRHPVLASELASLKAKVEDQERLRLLFDSAYPGAPAPERVTTRRDVPVPVEAVPERVGRRFEPRPQAEAFVERQEFRT